MMQPFPFRSLACALVALALAQPAAAQRVVGATGPAPAPVNLDVTGLFLERFASVGDDLFIGGQPTEKALRDLKAKGVTTVVNLRMPQEMAQISFDEAALLKELGITYVHTRSAARPTTRMRRRRSTASRPRWRRRRARCCCIARSPGARATCGARI